jgi:hypothetical protein
VDKCDVPLSSFKQLLISKQAVPFSSPLSPEAHVVHSLGTHHLPERAFNLGKKFVTLVLAPSLSTDLLASSSLRK